MLMTFSTAARAAVTAPTVKLSATSLPFSDQQAPTASPPKTLTVGNPGPAAVLLNSIAVVGGQADDFSQTNTCGAAIPAGGSCSIRVVFKPVSAGTKSASLSLTDSATGSPQHVALKGTGIVPVFSVNATALTVTVAPTSATPMPSLGLTIKNPDGAALFYGASVTGPAVLGANLVWNSAPVNGQLTGVAELTVDQPSLQGSGTFVSTVTLSACRDAACIRPLAGSPRKVTLTYVVTGSAIPAGSFFQSPTVLNVETPSNGTAPTTVVQLVGYSLPPYPVHVSYTTKSTTVIPSMSFKGFPSTGGYGNGQLAVNFAPPGQLGPGVYQDTITLSACYDTACKKPAIGSPWLIPVTYTVTASSGREFTQRIIAISAEAIAADPAGKYLYLADWESAQPITAAHLIKLNPTTGGKVSSVALDDYPRRVAISADGKYAYVVIALSATATQEIERINVATMTVDLRIPFPGSAPSIGDLAVSPLDSTTLAVSYSYVDPTLGLFVDVKIFDNGVARPNYVATMPGDTLPITIQWRPDGAQLYLRDARLLTMSAVESDGLTPVRTLLTLSNLIGAVPALHQANGLLYDEGGAVIDPTSPALVGRLAFRTPMSQSAALSAGLALDGPTNRAIAAYGDPASTALLNTLQSFDLNGLKSLWIARFAVPLRSPVRWGTDGLALIGQNTNPQAGQWRVYLIQGSFVAP